MSTMKLTAGSGGGSISLNGPTSASGDTDFLAANGDVNVTGDLTVSGTINQGLNRNLIINGAMMVAQRGTSATTENAYTTVDRWKETVAGTEEANTKTQHTLTSSDTGPWEKGWRYSWHIQNGNQTGGFGSDHYLHLEYQVEARDLANSGWEYTSSSSDITLSYWVKSSVAQTFHGYIATNDGTSWAYAFSTGALTANTWKKVEVTIPGNSNLTVNSDNGNGLTVAPISYWGTDATTSGRGTGWLALSGTNRTPDATSTWWTTNDATLEITGVQLEVGSVASAFEHRLYHDELLRCQRYYYVATLHDNGNVLAYIGPGVNWSSTDARVDITLPVKMRGTPSLEKVVGLNYFRYNSHGSNFDPDDVAAAESHPTRCMIQVTDDFNGTQGSGGWLLMNNYSAKIAFNAEL